MARRRAADGSELIDEAVGAGDVDIDAQAALEGAAAAPDAAPKKKDGAEIKKHFVMTRTGSHTVGGNGPMAGQVMKCAWFACKRCRTAFTHSTVH